METGYPAPTSSRAGNAARERDPNCIEMTLKQLEVEMAESLNSAENLADKLKGSEKQVRAGQPSSGSPDGGDIAYRVNRILNTVRQINQELGRSHSAISG